MNISQKLTLTAIVSVVLMALIGGTGLYVAREVPPLIVPRAF